MAYHSSIEWTDATWNVVVGCSKVVDAGEWTGRVNMVHDRLTLPMRWTKPRRIFVNAQSDLFHKGVSDDFIARVLAVMALTPHHTYQVLTKRPGRMRALLSSPDFREAVIDHVCWYDNPAEVPRVPWPLPNVHIGVSVEDQKAADLRTARYSRASGDARAKAPTPLGGPSPSRGSTPMQTDPLVLAYMAGVIDSDGFITINRSTRKGRTYFGAVIGVSGTRRQPHDLAASLWGGTVWLYTPKDPTQWRPTT